MQYLLVLLMGIGLRPNKSEQLCQNFFKIIVGREKSLFPSREKFWGSYLCLKDSIDEPEVKQLSTQEYSQKAEMKTERKKTRKF